MLDEELGGPALDAGAVPASVGLIMPLEAQGYETVEDGRTTTLLADFSPAHALRRAADACKLLLPYRVDHEPSAVRQDALVEATAAACHEVDLPLVIEPVVYRWSTETPPRVRGELPGIMTMSRGSDPSGRTCSSCRSRCSTWRPTVKGPPPTPAAS